MRSTERKNKTIHHVFFFLSFFFFFGGGGKGRKRPEPSKQLDTPNDLNKMCLQMEMVNFSQNSTKNINRFENFKIFCMVK